MVFCGSLTPLKPKPHALPSPIPNLINLIKAHIGKNTLSCELITKKGARWARASPLTEQLIKFLASLFSSYIFAAHRKLNNYYSRLLPGGAAAKEIDERRRARADRG
jgi:phosphoglycerate dehydrogenase-like enzyme